MNPKDYVSQVKEFHQSFDHPILPSPTIPDKKRCDFRLSLLSEELKELAEAIEKNDLVEVADAFCDIQYVLSGAILEFGMGEKFNDLFKEIHRSNMSKACATFVEAEKTVKFYFDTEGTECFIKPKDEVFLVYRKSDNKTLKSINYSPANLKPIIA